MKSIIHIYPSHYEINNIDEIPYIINYELSKWNSAYFRRENIGFYYDAEEKVLRIPKGYSIERIQNIWKYNDIIDHTNEFNLRSDIDISLTNAPRSWAQESTLAFMLGMKPYEFTNKDSQLYVDLDTGEGKTFAGIAAISYFKSKALIISPNIEKVTNQWVDSICKFTTLKHNEFLHVKGAKMCADIIRGKYNNVKIFIVQRSTLLAFVKKYDNNWNMLTKLVESMDVGIKIIDEAHMDFSTIVKIECFINVPKTYYMSASPSRSEKEEKRIYNKIFSNIPKHGSKLKTKEQNHIIPLILQFKSTPSYEWLKAIRTRYGTSLNKYGEYLLAEDGARDEFIDAFTYALYLLQQFRRRNGKILVIGFTIEFCKELQKITKEIFPYLKTGLYVGPKSKEKQKELDADVIFSTTKSMGTGADIENAQMLINTLTYSSEITANQIPGRIRKQEGRKGIYCEIVNIAHEVARKHYQEREKFLKKKAKNGVIITSQISDYELNDMMNFFKNKYKINGSGQFVTEDGLIKIQKKR